MSRGTLDKRIAISQTPDEMPACPCCGATMEVYPTSFGKRIVIEDYDYYCNNPVCNCEIDLAEKNVDDNH